MQRQALSRIQQYVDAGVAPPLPSVPQNGSYLIDAMMVMGPVRETGAGATRQADWAEILPFMQVTRRISEPWEGEALFRLCGAYLRGNETGEDPFGIAPLERPNR